jgi:endonuclease-8
MPEGPSIVILKEEAEIFKGQKILKVTGNSTIGIERFKNQKIIDFKSWGKHFLICFKDFTLKIHLMLFGSYRINEFREDRVPRISFEFKNGNLTFYNCSAKIIEEDLDLIYDWEVDTMSDEWNPEKALALLNKLKNTFACDVLLDQNIFAGSGNIIKNEVLYRIKVHPLAVLGTLSREKKREMVEETRNYCFDFYRWKKKYELRKHWLVYKQKECVRCKIPIKLKYLGKTKRRTFFCDNCQLLYVKAKNIKIAF